MEKSKATVQVDDIIIIAEPWRQEALCFDSKIIVVTLVNTVRI